MAQVELRKEVLEHRFQGSQDVADFFTGMACNTAEWLEFVQTATELQPGRIRQIKHFLQGNGGSAPRRHQTQAKRMATVSVPGRLLP